MGHGDYRARHSLRPSARPHLGGRRAPRRRRARARRGWRHRGEGSRRGEGCGPRGGTLTSHSWSSPTASPAGVQRLPRQPRRGVDGRDRGPQRRLVSRVAARRRWTVVGRAGRMPHGRGNRCCRRSVSRIPAAAAPGRSTRAKAEPAGRARGSGRGGAHRPGRERRLRRCRPPGRAARSASSRATTACGAASRTARRMSANGCNGSLPVVLPAELRSTVDIDGRTFIVTGADPGSGGPPRSSSPARARTSSASTSMSTAVRERRLRSAAGPSSFALM